MNRVRNFAAEYIYGASSVLPALEAQQRRIFKLFIKSNHELELTSRAIKMANLLQIPIQEMSKPQLDKLSQGRPNQGLIMQVSPIIPKTIVNLGVFKENQVQEDEYSLQLTSQTIKKYAYKHRMYPLWLALDPQNLGAILRTAHFFKLDGIVMSNECAPLSPTVSKASSGAMELMDNVYVCSNLASFLTKSIHEGWHCYGTDLSSDQEKIMLNPAYETPPLLHSPTILVVGNEGKGIRSKVSKLCHQHVIIHNHSQSPNQTSYSVDSLNVSVATGILIQRIIDS